MFVCLWCTLLQLHKRFLEGDRRNYKRKWMVREQEWKEALSTLPKHYFIFNLNHVHALPILRIKKTTFYWVQRNNVPIKIYQLNKRFTFFQNKLWEPVKWTTFPLLLVLVSFLKQLTINPLSKFTNNVWGQLFISRKWRVMMPTSPHASLLSAQFKYKDFS